jgi:hypothetical protein
MELANVPGDECLKYVAELSASRCSLGPREISFVDHGAPPRDFLARTTDSTVRWFRSAWRSASQRFGPQPPAPLDPFALDHSAP